MYLNLTYVRVSTGPNNKYYHDVILINFNKNIVSQIS